MGTLTAFNFISLDGYFEGPGKGDISWHRPGPEENAYSAEMLRNGDILLFGRITYELMASFWPTPLAQAFDPIVAGQINKADKIVFSKTLTYTNWTNTTIVSENIEDVIQQKKNEGRNMTILGSSTILTQLANAGLVNEYQFMVIPILLGSGTPILKGLTTVLNFKLVSTRALGDGVVILCYHPVK